MSKIFVTFLILLLTTGSFCQTLSFSDLQLKQFLLNENCIDTNADGFNDINADFNQDGEIHTSEADLILNLHIGYYNDSYFIKSIRDISQFHNLELLQLMHNDSLSHISNLGLDSLRTLMVGSEFSLRYVDVSDLKGLMDLRIEDCDTLDYLNIQNGSVAQNFSLFYTEHIHYACVDSIAAEYDEVAWRMISGTPSFNCITSVPDVTEMEGFHLFPNPAIGKLNIGFYLIQDQKMKIEVFDMHGRIVKLIQDEMTSGLQTIEMDVSNFDQGTYIIRSSTKDFSRTDRLVIQ